MVTQTLFLVASDQTDLYHHLAQEFVGQDVQVIIDRRGLERRLHAERRRRVERGRERRALERRKRRSVERDLRSIGFTIIQTEEPIDFWESPRANATALREVRAYLVDRFRYYSPVPTWDFGRNGQTYVLLSGQGRPAHRVIFEKDFLDYYGTTMPDRIPSLLEEWKLAYHLEVAGSTLVVVSSYGIQIG
jgi:hypothetical protein